MILPRRKVPGVSSSIQSMMSHFRWNLGTKAWLWRLRPASLPPPPSFQSTSTYDLWTASHLSTGHASCLFPLLAVVSPSQWDCKILEGRDQILSSFGAQPTTINFTHSSAGGEEKKVVWQMGSDATLDLKGPSGLQCPLCPGSQQPGLLSLPLAHI